MDLGLKGKRALVLAASRGLGYACARGLAQEGCQLVICSRDEARIQAAADRIRTDTGAKVEALTADVSNAPEAERLVGAAVSAYGGLEILVHNAGLVRTDPLDVPGGNANQLFGSLDYALLDDFIHTNVAGPLKITETFIENVRAGRQKKIVAISSAAGSVSVPPFMPNGAPLPDHYWYRISKAALNSAMRLLAAQFEADGITVVMFHPGGVQVESFGTLRIPGLQSPQEAIGNMIRTIDGLSSKDSGRFLDNDGSDHAW